MIVVRLLGRPVVTIDGRTATLSPRAIGVLARLALDDGWVSRDRLLMDLWGDDVRPERVRSLQTIVSQVRSLLPGGTATLQYRHGMYHLDRSAVRCDVAWLADHVRNAERAIERDDRSLAVAHARAARELFDGDTGLHALGESEWLDGLAGEIEAWREMLSELWSSGPAPHPPAGVSYLLHDGRHLAYWCFGSGTPAIVLLGGLATHLEGQWDEPRWASWATALAINGRVVCLDKRGTGLSDSIDHVPTIDDFAADTLAVMDAVGASTVVLVACGEAGLYAPRLATMAPDRVSAVVFVNAIPKVLRSDDFPIGVPRPASSGFFVDVQDRWGGGAVALDLAAPSVAADESFMRWAGRYQRLCTTPRSLEFLARFTERADARPDVAAMTQPALVLQSRDSRYFSPRNATWLHDHLGDAELVWLDSADHLYWLADPTAALAAIEWFVRSLNSR